MHPNQPGFQNLAQEGDGRPALYVDTTSRSRHPQPSSSTSTAPAPFLTQIRPVFLPGRTSLPVNPPPSPPYTTASTASTSANVSFSPDGAPEQPEKRKRSRVTPAQLARLEELFASDRSPTVGRRKEISAELGMRERQTQIWFQNRRAKAKVQEGRGKPRSKKSSNKKAEGAASTASPSNLRPYSGDDSSPNEDDEVDEDDDIERRPGSVDHPRYLAQLARRFDERSSINLVPCRSLKIGTWRSVSDAQGGRDLVTYTVQRPDGHFLIVVWHFKEGDQSFKMEVPSSSIETAQVIIEEVNSVTVATARLRLSRKPGFYHHRSSSGPLPSAAASPALGAAPFWVPCADFTQGGAVSSTDVYELEGPSHTMIAALRTLPGFASVLSQPAVLPHSVQPSTIPIHAPTPVVPIPAFMPQTFAGSMAPSYPSYHIPGQAYGSDGSLSGQQQQNHPVYVVDTASGYPMPYPSTQSTQQAHGQPRLVLPSQSGTRVSHQSTEGPVSSHVGPHISPLSSMVPLSSISPQVSHYLPHNGGTFIAPLLNRAYFQNPQGGEHGIPDASAPSYTRYSVENSQHATGGSVYQSAAPLSDSFLGPTPYSQPYGGPSHVTSPIPAGYSSPNAGIQSTQTGIPNAGYDWADPLAFDPGYPSDHDVDTALPAGGPNAT